LGGRRPTRDGVSCDTLAVAHAIVAAGPNFDQLKPPKALSFRGDERRRRHPGVWQTPQIDAIAAYVASSVGNKEPP
jgi:hypothetical protein